MSFYSTSCVHFNGCQMKVCEKGVNYRQLAGGPDHGWATRLPCVPPFKKTAGTPATCEHHRLPTAEEVTKYELEIQMAMDRVRKLEPILQRIRAEHRGQDWKGTEPCPMCQGTLHIHICSFNGHTHGVCTTPGCLNWQE